MNFEPFDRIPAPDREARLTELLGNEGKRYTVRCFSTLDSTNAEAKRMALSGHRGRAILLAARQSAGRGRMERNFYSPTGGLYFSILCPIEGALSEVVPLTGATAVAVMRAIAAKTGKQTAIKWVNDLYLADRKVAGILAEAVSVGNACYLIIGVGVNLTETSFPPELADRAGSLMADGLAPEELLAAILAELTPFLDRPDSRAWLEDYRRHSMVIGREVLWTKNGETFAAFAEDVGNNGELILRTPDGKTELLRTGEITLRLAK